MIIDKVKNMSKYKELKPIADFLKKNENTVLENGKYPIDDNCYLKAMEYDTKPENGDFENHDVYADLQMLVLGSEYLQTTKNCGATLSKEYNSEKDISFYSAKEYSNFLMESGYFALILPNELHRSGICEDNPIHIKKYVFKIKM